MLQVRKEDLMPIFEEAISESKKLNIDLEEQDLQVLVSYFRGDVTLITENPKYYPHVESDEPQMLFLAEKYIENWKDEYLSQTPSHTEEEFFELLKGVLTEIIDDIQDKHDIELYSLIVDLGGFEEVDLTESSDDAQMGSGDLSASFAHVQAQLDAQLEQMAAMYANVPGFDLEAMKLQMQAQMEANMNTVNAMSNGGGGDDDDDDELFPIMYNPAGSTLTKEQDIMISYGAPINVMHGHYVNSITSGEDIDELREGLESWWEIVDEESAVETLTWLLEEGHSRSRDFVLDLMQPDKFNWNHRVYAIHSIFKEDPEEAMNMENIYFSTMKMVRIVNDKGFEAIPEIPKSIAAWDYVRCITMSRNCYELGYISEARMWEFISEAATKIRATFNSWQEYGASFAFGRGVWRWQKDDLKYADHAVRSILNSLDKFPWK